MNFSLVAGIRSGQLLLQAQRWACLTKNPTIKDNSDRGASFLLQLVANDQKVTSEPRKLPRVRYLRPGGGSARIL
jgi:hypothetical protein